MDTRSKILTAPQAFRPASRPLVVVTGYFDVLRAGHARELEQIRARTGAGALLVAVLPLEGAALSRSARAELVAALRVVDYVVAADQEHLDGLIGSWEPLEVVRLEAADIRRSRQFIEHVHRRQTS